MQYESFIATDALLCLPPHVHALRVRFEGGEGRGRVQLELFNRLARRIAATSEIEQPRLEEVALSLLDAHRPGWASGGLAHGTLLINLATGEARLESDAAGQGTPPRQLR